MISSSMASTAAAPAKSTQTTQTLSVAKATFSSSEVTAKGASSDNVVSIGKSMEGLLDNVSGVAARNKQKSSTDDATDGGSKGGGQGGFSSAALDRAKEAESIMSRLASARDSFAEGLGRALKGLEESFGGALDLLGAPKDQIDSAKKDFSSMLQDKTKGIDFSQLAVDYQSSSTQFSIETHGIDVVVQDGDRELKISYAKSTLDLRREDESLQAQIGKGGDAMVNVGQSTTTADGKSEGMIINAKGFSADEVEKIVGRLNELSSGGGGSKGGGAAMITPEKRADGTLKLKLDLASFMPPASDTSAGAASASAAASTAALASGAAAKPPVSAGFSVTA